MPHVGYNHRCMESDSDINDKFIDQTIFEIYFILILPKVISCKVIEAVDKYNLRLIRNIENKLCIQMIEKKLLLLIDLFHRTFIIHRH